MRPKQGLIVEALPDGGMLVIDEARNQSHALAPQAASVLGCLERGTSELHEIASAVSLEVAAVEAVLAELAAAGLIEENDGSSRREWLARAATVAGAAVGLKLVESIAVPSPAAAQSDRDSQAPV